VFLLVLGGPENLDELGAGVEQVSEVVRVDTRRHP
jgi:hypothetical protein